MIGIIIVIFKSHEQTRRYVLNELPKIHTEHRTVVVDLCSEPVVSQQFAADVTGIWTNSLDLNLPESSLYVLHTKENLGYAKGNNLGVRFLLKLFPNIDKLLISNDDIEYTSPDVVDVLSQRLDESPTVGCIGPKVVDLNGTLQGPGYRKPDIWYYIRRNIGEPFLGAAYFARDTTRPRIAETVNIVGGCFLMMPTKDFMAAGMFDERTFLYWEEEIISERLSAIGKTVYYEPSVEVLHYVGNTTSKSAPNLLLVKCELAGQNLYFSCYRQRNIALRLLLFLSGRIRLFLVWLCTIKHAFQKRMKPSTP